MNHSYKLSVFSKYYFRKHNTVGIVTKQLIVVGLKFQFYLSNVDHTENQVTD